MKYLSDYTQEAQSALFKELKVFFAFSNEQFTEGVEKAGIEKGERIASMGMGMYLPTNNVDEFLDRHKALVDDAIKLDLKENGREGILMREMGNYEVGYTGEMDENFMDAIRDYKFTKEEINAAYRKTMELEYA